MAFGGFDGHHEAAPMADINMTPLIDVMLVLLVIFIITAPLLTHAIRLDLPKVDSASARETPKTITLSIDDAGQIYWNDKPSSLEAVRALLVAAGRAPQQPEIHLRAARATHYDIIAQVMGAAQQAGLERIGFVTEPPSGAQAGEKGARSNAQPSTQPSTQPAGQPTMQPGLPPGSPR